MQTIQEGDAWRRLLFLSLRLYIRPQPIRAYFFDKKSNVSAEIAGQVVNEIPVSLFIAMDAFIASSMPGKLILLSLWR
jgi:hypothetical protein